MPGWSTSPAARQSGTRSPVRSLELLGLVIVSLAAVFWGFSVIEGKPGPCCWVSTAWPRRCL